MKSKARKKQSQEETRTWRKSDGRRKEMEKVRRKQMQVRENVGKSRNTVFFQCFVAPEGRKVGAEVAGQMRDEKLHALLARNTFASQKWQNTSVSEHFWKLECRKSDALVARSTFGSEHVQSTAFSEHFWKLRCRKSEKCTTLSRETLFQVKMYKAPQLWQTFRS